MNKSDFLKLLDKKLKNLPKEERKKSLAFYSEIIDDKKEDGASEEDAVASLGSPEKVAKEILSDSSFASLVKGSVDRVKKSGSRKSPWLIVLLILGFPLWFPLLAAALIVIFVLTFSGAIVLLSLFISLFAVQFAILFSGAVFAVQSFFCLFTGEPALGIFMLGLAFILIPLFFLLLSPIGKLEKVLLKLCKGWIKGIKRLFINKKEV